MDINRFSPESAVAKFNAQGVEVLTDEEVLSIGDVVSARLSELQLPSLDSADAIEGDTAHGNAVDQYAPVSVLTIVAQNGESRSVELRGDSGIGKSGASTALRMGIASKFGLDVNSENPHAVVKFVTLAIRYAALKAGQRQTSV